MLKSNSADYNVGSPLEVKSLPLTGNQFKNKPQNFVWTGDFKKNVFIGLKLGTHFCSLGDWRDQFVFEKGQEPGNGGFLLGGNLGLAISNRFNIGLGYSKFWGPKVDLGGSAFDRVYFNYYSVFVRIGGKYKNIPGLSIFGHVAIGSLQAKEKLNDGQSNELEVTKAKVAPHLKFICEYFTRSNTSITFEAGLLLADVSDLEFLGQPVPDYSLNFTGLSLLTGINFHFPIK